MHGGGLFFVAHVYQGVLQYSIDPGSVGQIYRVASSLRVNRGPKRSREAIQDFIVDARVVFTLQW